MPSHGRDMVELSVTISFYKLLHLVPLNLDPLTMPLLSRASSPQPSLISTCPSVELTLQASPTFIVLLSTRLPDGFALPPWSTTTLFLKACRFFFFPNKSQQSTLYRVHPDTYSNRNGSIGPQEDEMGVLYSFEVR